MKKSALYTFIGTVILLAIYSFTLKEIEWNLQSEGVKVEFKMPEEGQDGEFKKMSASIKFDPSDLSGAYFHAEVEVGSLDAGNGMKTKHLKSDDFFDAEKYPKMIFDSKQVQKTDTGFVVTGTLKVKDTENTYSIPFKFLETKDNKGMFTGTFKLHTSQVGLTHKSIKSQKKQEIKENVIVKITVPVVMKN